MVYPHINKLYLETRQSKQIQTYDQCYIKY